ncbi:HlyD family type I secretion periplasmic adaptor subunit [uncultured Sphingomonas sp.]|uniref:HlyD family type I secretion periplasmic adaptor subunit n=1 Tax=uncultured Sphingomonas sp. TaxID=158754 RepID=UPI0025CE0A74|nr:HlyD family type I secretion periplasmic adaptor subunit [uncultured Sphingomonas sp.]
MTQAVLGAPVALPENPRSEIRAALLVGGAFFVGLLGWGAYAQLDAAAYAPGAVKVTGDAQAVQTPDGGVISAVHVVEGQQVRAGQVVIEFATTEALAQERSLATRVISLQADIARLQAQLAGGAGIEAPAAFASLDARDQAEAARAMTVARGQFAAWQNAHSSEQRLLGERMAQVGNQLGGYAARQSANAEQQKLNSKELATVSMLASKGYATQNRVLALQRNAADLEGQRGAQAAEMARLHNEGGAARMQLLQNRAQEGEQLSAQLRQDQTDLQSLLPQWQAARDALARRQLRAPTSGAVMGLAFKASGGVATAGQALMKIVPADRSLSVEAQVAPADVNDLVVGQDARVRLTGLHGRNVPTLDGAVTRISADSFTEERTGRAFYTATVRVAPAEFDRASKAAGLRGALRPGTPAQVEITLRKRSGIDYLLDPLTQAFNGALHER